MPSPNSRRNPAPSRDAIIAILRERGTISYDELVAAIAPSPPTASRRLREARRANVIKSVSRARLELLKHGQLIGTLATGTDRRRLGLTLITLPDECDDQTMAELTLGRRA